MIDGGGVSTVILKMINDFKSSYKSGNTEYNNMIVEITTPEVLLQVLNENKSSGDKLSVIVMNRCSIYHDIFDYEPDYIIAGNIKALNTFIDIYSKSIIDEQKAELKNANTKDNFDGIKKMLLDAICGDSKELHLPKLGIPDSFWDFINNAKLNDDKPSIKLTDLNPFKSPTGNKLGYSTEQSFKLSDISPEPEYPSMNNKNYEPFDLGIGRSEILSKITNNKNNGRSKDSTCHQDNTLPNNSEEISTEFDSAPLNIIRRKGNILYTGIQVSNSKPFALGYKPKYSELSDSVSVQNVNGNDEITFCIENLDTNINYRKGMRIGIVVFCDGVIDNEN
jgi:hypothetical protein